MLDKDHLKNKSRRILTLPYKVKVIWPSEMFKLVGYDKENPFK